MLEGTQETTAAQGVANTLEAILADHLAAPDAFQPPMPRLNMMNWRIVLAALRSSGAGAEMRDDHRVEALKAEARDRAFQHELAESVLKSERERWLRAGRRALGGNLAPLRRIIERTENPVPIQGSSALPLDGGRS